MHRFRRPTGLLWCAAAASLTLAASAHAVTFSNAAPIAISDASPTQVPSASTPYPAAIAVSGVVGPVTQVTATLHGFAHTCPTDVDVLLVGPHGQESILMSDAGDCTGNSRDPVDLTFQDGATPMPCLEAPSPATLAGGTYAPTDTNESNPSACSSAGADPDVFDPPAPQGPWPIGLGAFNGVDPNGAWSLYTMDQYTNDSGSINGGWTLNLTIAPGTLTTAPSINGSPDVGKTLAAVSGTLGNGAAASYQWSRCAASGTGCSPIVGPTQGTYKPVGADRGHALIVTEMGVTSGGNSAPLASKPTRPVGPAVLSSAGTKRSQHVLTQHGLIASIKSNIGGSLTATATVGVPSAAKTVRFETARKRLSAGKKATVKLKLSNSGLAGVRSALASGKRLKAKLTLTVKDAGGGKATKRLTVRLR